VRNDPGKSNLVLLFLFWAFSGDENLASSQPSPQPRLLFGRQEKPHASPLRAGASVPSILVSTESADFDELN
jgi:hypothetical protein